MATMDAEMSAPKPEKKTGVSASGKVLVLNPKPAHLISYKAGHAMVKILDVGGNPVQLSSPTGGDKEVCLHWQILDDWATIVLSIEPDLVYINADGESGEYLYIDLAAVDEALAPKGMIPCAHTSMVSPDKPPFNSLVCACSTDTASHLRIYPSFQQPTAKVMPPGSAFRIGAFSAQFTFWNVFGLLAVFLLEVPAIGLAELFIGLELLFSIGSSVYIVDRVRGKKDHEPLCSFGGACSIKSWLIFIFFQAIPLVPVYLIFVHE